MSLDKITPIGNRLLVKRKIEERRKNGIIIPESSKVKNDEFEVIGISNQINNSFSIGDIVILERYAGQEINIYDQECIIVKEDQIIAKVSEANG